jgi:hypothetical protein
MSQTPDAPTYTAAILAAAARRGWDAHLDGDAVVVTDGRRVARHRVGGAAERVYERRMAATTTMVPQAQARARLLGSVRWPTRRRSEPRTTGA